MVLVTAVWALSRAGEMRRTMQQAISDSFISRMFCTHKMKRFKLRPYSYYIRKTLVKGNMRNYAF
jgi:hypothetical protein